MRIKLIFFAFYMSGEVFAQDASNISTKLNQIKAIPCSYIKSETAKPKFYDQAFDYILKQDTFAIPALISLLTDTSVSNVKNLGESTYYKNGDLALILINYIEWVPCALVTNLQWCICCDCGFLPTDFLKYVARDRHEFKRKYQSYYTSIERRKSIKLRAKELKKKGRT